MGVLTVTAPLSPSPALSVRSCQAPSTLAGMIYDALSDRKKGRRYLSEALSPNPLFDLVQAGAPAARVEAVSGRDCKTGS